MLFDNLLNYPPFSVQDDIKESILKKALKEEFDYHYKMCLLYQNYCKKQNFTPSSKEFAYEDLPFLPVNIFKEMLLSSLPSKQNYQLIRSSATSSQKPSSVVLDQITKTRQVKTLSWLLSDLLGNKRLPFIIFDAQEDPKSKNDLSARNAAIRGFLIGSSSHFFALEGLALEINIKELEKNLAKFEDQEIILFGYTYIIFHNVAKVLAEKGKTFNLSKAKIIHIGGWKKLQNEAVTKDCFNQTLSEVFGVKKENIIDIYGFTEQLGLIYPDFGEEFKRCPIVSEIIVRDPTTLKPVRDGEVGLLEFITPLPHSYPGIAILTDDLGKIVSRDKSKNNRFGTAFKVIGRAKEAELRGCGDVLSEIIKS